MTNRTTEEIARGLTEAMRKAVLTDDADSHPQWKGMWSCWGDRQTAAEMYRLGLTETGDTLSRPTPLGLAVRSHLESHKP